MERLATLLKAFSPWDGISLTYRQFAAEIGAPVTEAAVKKWPQRKRFPADVARLIVARARERGLVGVTLEWVLWGEGAKPQKAPNATQNIPASHPSPVPEVAEGQRVRSSAAPPEPHGQFPARIARALEADLSQNERWQDRPSRSSAGPVIERRQRASRFIQTSGSATRRPPQGGSVRG